jgi:hypothetical protein
MIRSTTPHSSVLAGIFRRSIAERGYARLFEEWSREEQGRLLAAVQLVEGEVPVVGSIGEDEYRILVTTHRIVWSCDAELHSLEYSDIRSFDFDKANYLHNTVGKGNWQFIDIVDRTGTHHSLRIYPQQNAFNTFWKLLAFAVRHNNQIDPRREPDQHNT